MGNNLSLARVNRVIDSYEKFVKLLPLGQSLAPSNHTWGPIATTCDGHSVTKINPYGFNELTGTGAIALDFISTSSILPVNVASSLVELSEQTKERQLKWCKHQLEYKLTEVVKQAKMSLVNAIGMKSTATTMTSDEATTGLAAAENTFKTAWNDVSKATSDVCITENKLHEVMRAKTSTVANSDHACAEHREASKTMNDANVNLAAARGALDVARQLMNPTKVITDCEDRICEMNAVIARVSEMIELLKIE